MEKHLNMIGLKMTSREDKINFMKMSLSDKIKRSKTLIMDWNAQFSGKVYVSFSGGKDSTVLLHLVRNTIGCSNVEAVFVNTGLEFPEIVSFVKKTENTIIIKPKKTFKEVIEKYGFPVVSKEQSKYIHDFNTTGSEYIRKIRLEGNRNGSFKISKKWRFLLNAPFKISSLCCDYLKKKPVHDYYKTTGKTPFIGVMASESNLRLQFYMNGECNAFNAKFPSSRPIFFWNEQDIKDYIKLFDLEICDLYTKHGYERTGCMFCMYGLERERVGQTRFDKMKKTHPQIYNYCMKKLGLEKVINFISNNGKNILT